MDQQVIKVERCLKRAIALRYKVWPADPPHYIQYSELLLLPRSNDFVDQINVYYLGQLTESPRYLSPDPSQRRGTSY